MQYNLSISLDRERFKAKVNKLYTKGAVVEVTEKVTKTPSQNRYLHLLIGVVALETGNTLEDTKQWYFKRLVNKDIFFISKVDKLGQSIETIRSCADLTKEEMSVAIDRFKRWGNDNGIYMPSPEDVSLLRDIEIELGRVKQYL